MNTEHESGESLNEPGLIAEGTDWRVCEDTNAECGEYDWEMV